MILSAFLDLGKHPLAVGDPAYCHIDDPTRPSAPGLSVQILELERFCRDALDAIEAHRSRKEAA